MQLACARWARWLVFGPIKDQFGLTGCARLHRRRGDRRGHLRLLPRAGRQPAPALRPDREQRLQRRCRPPRSAPAHGGPAAAGRGGEDQRRRRDPGAIGQRLRRLPERARSHARRARSTAGCTPATPATSNPTATWSCSAGCRKWCTPPRASATSRTTSRTASSSALRQGRGGARRRARRLGAIVCIDKEPVGHWAELRGISYMSYADLSQKPR
jgi:hypothetical protein